MSREPVAAGSLDLAAAALVKGAAATALVVAVVDDVAADVELVDENESASGSAEVSLPKESAAEKSARVRVGSEQWR